MRKGGALAHQPVRETGKCEANSGPQAAKTKKAANGADEEYRPGRQAIAKEAGDDAEALAEVVGDAEEGDLPLLVSHCLLEGVGVEGEGISRPGSHLHQHRCRKSQPRLPAAGSHRSSHLADPTRSASLSLDL